MTHPPDEILSALLDGEAVDALDAAHVDTCGACQARLEGLRRVAAVLATPVLPAAHVREAAVATALVYTAGPTAAVRRLATARRARTTRAASSAPGMRRTASVAAALAVGLGVGGWLLSQTAGTANRTPAKTAHAALAGDSAGGRTRSANPTRASNGETVFATPGQRGGASAGTDSGTASPSTFYNAGDIGDFSETAPILDRYRQYAAGSPAEEGSYMADSPCPTPDDRVVVWHADLTYRGIEAFARVLMKDQSDPVLQILNRADCALVESQAI